MRIYSAVIAHESNSFSPLPTNLESYREATYYDPATGEGRAALVSIEDTAPFGSLARERGHDLVQGLIAVARPSAPTVQGSYELIRDAILDGLRAAGPVDAVLLFLHGAQMARGYDDCEGDVFEKVREIVGPDTFVGASLDLHCNLTPAMTDNANALVACKEYPHTDFPETALRLMEIAEQAHANGVAPEVVFQPVPLLGFFHTTREPMRSFVDGLAAYETEDIQSVTLAHGFPFADQAHTGAGVIVVARRGSNRAERVAREVGQEFFRLRSEIDATHPTYVEAIRLLEGELEAGGGPIVLADPSDNPGGGAPGDSTFILRELLRRGVRNAALACIWDPEAVKVAAGAGVGGRLRMRIGGKLGPLSGDPLDVDAEVLAVNPDAGQRTFGDDPEPLGLSAAIQVEGVTVVLVSKRQQTFSPDCFTTVGIDPLAKSLLVVKSSQHFYARFEAIARQIRYCRAPGYLDADFTKLPFEKLARPIWPLDEAPFARHGLDWG